MPKWKGELDISRISSSNPFNLLNLRRHRVQVIKQVIKICVYSSQVSSVHHLYHSLLLYEGQNHGRYILYFLVTCSIYLFAIQNTSDLSNLVVVCCVVLWSEQWCEQTGASIHSIYMNVLISKINTRELNRGQQYTLIAKQINSITIIQDILIRRPRSPTPGTDISMYNDAFQVASIYGAP